MLALIIISSIMLLVALLNWGQSQNFFRRIINFFNKRVSLEDDSVQHSYVTGAGSSAVIEGDDLEDYAYDDDSDYCDQ